ncbi:MAG: serine hydrolase, partial [candidate division WOR-3 bacterium]
IDVVMGIKTLGSPAGYAKPTELFDFGSESAFGFTGSGGSFAFADPEYGLGYAYVMNKMDFYGMNDPREVALRETVYACIDRADRE